MGKTIRIYFPSDSASGMRHAEIVNWTGQALSCPRSRFKELIAWPELDRPGVYFLFGVHEETGEDAAYIGEAEKVIERLSSHVSEKMFWNEVVAFTNKDDYLTKSHVKYLESKLLTLTAECKRYSLINTARPKLPLLPRSDADAMDEFLESIKLLLAALGHKTLEPFVARMSKPVEVAAPDEAMATLVADMLTAHQGKVMETSPVFTLNVSGLECRSVRTDEGLVVFAHSDASATALSSLTGGLRAKREALIEAGVLVPFGDKLRMMRDHLFKSPSQAASILAGYSMNGRANWRLSDGTSYGEYETALSNDLLTELEAPQPP